MRLGLHLRELWRHRLGTVLSVLIALFAAVWSVAHISLLPPRLEPRALDMATAYTQLVVDTPHSAVLDLRQPTDDILPLKNRALLIGTLMASAPVRAYIAHRAGIPVASLQIVAPRTPQQPRPTETSGKKKGPGDLFKSTDQYRLDIDANPTVPILDINAQAPSAKSSAELANAAVTGLGDYLRDLAVSEQTPNEAQVHVRQLGTARGAVINHGVRLQVVFVVFTLVLAMSCAATIFIARVRRGWQLAEASA
jgi:hypothetical protein